MFRRLSSSLPCARAAMTGGLMSSGATASRSLFTATASRLHHPGGSSQKATVKLPAPQFSANAVIDGAIKPVNLSDYKGKYVVLLFYPLDFTFVCPTEIIAFSDKAAEFEKIGAQVLAISVDSEFSHLAWSNLPRKKGGLGKLNIPLVSDITKNIACDYGVLVEEAGVALRGLFIIDGKGVLRSVTINDAAVGRNVDEAFRTVQGFQYADENGEVVPCGWKPGGDTINPAKASEYFEKAN